MTVNSRIAGINRLKKISSNEKSIIEVILNNRVVAWLITIMMIMVAMGSLMDALSNIIEILIKK